jgi:hypothetical protein
MVNAKFLILHSNGVVFNCTSQSKMAMSEWGPNCENFTNKTSYAFVMLDLF